MLQICHNFVTGIIFVMPSTWRGATPPRVEMRVKLLPWMSAASSGVPRLDGLAKVEMLVGGSPAFVGIGFDVVPAGAPISNWNCSSGEFKVGIILFNFLGLSSYLCFCSSKIRSHCATATSCYN